MRLILSEYGLLMITCIGGIFALWAYNFMDNHYEEFSKNFIGCITGSYVAYDSELTLEQIEEGLY